MEKTLSPVQARQEYFHFLAVAGQRFIGYREWKRSQEIEVESTPYVKKLIELTGYPGHSEIDDIYYWVADELWLIEVRISDMKTYLAGLISTNLAITIASLIDAYAVMSNTINSVNLLIGEVHRSLLTVVSKTGELITAAIVGAADLITRAIQTAQSDTAIVANAIRNGIVEAFRSLDDNFALMYQQFEDAILSQTGSGSSTLEVLGNVIIAAIKASITLAVTIVESLALVIQSAVESTERVLIALVKGIVSTVDILVTGLKEIIEGTINSLIETFKWLWGEVVALLDKMFDFDIENLSQLFVTLFEAQQKAFAMLKERAETVQP